MERKLATLRSVTDIKPIEGADFIELALIDGWQCVVKKGEFKVGSVGVYFEIDSFIKLGDPRFDFLAKDKIIWCGKEGVRIKTRKFRKAIAQGLLMPLAEFPELSGHSVGNDVTEILGIEKWEPIIPAGNFSRQFGGKKYKPHGFPSFIPKTDEERVQNLPDVIEQNKNYLFEVTEKLDGTSATFFYGGPDMEFGVCSRNIWIKKSHDNFLMKAFRWLKKKLWHFNLETDRINSYWKIAKQYQLDKIMPKLGKQYAFQGEIIGEGIQRNHYHMKGQEFYLFNIFDIERRVYLTPVERKVVLEMMAIQHGVVIKHIPVLFFTVLNESYTNIQEIINEADGQSAINIDTIREGIVFKRTDAGMHFKAVSNKFLLKTGE